MDTRGTHLLIDYSYCQTKHLSDKAFIKELLLKAAKEANTEVVGEVFHQYSPQGISGIVLVAESHLSIHTWPEDNYAAVDIYTCGDCHPLKAHESIKRSLQTSHFEMAEIQRGLVGPNKIQLPSKTRISKPDTKSTRQIRIDPKDLEIDDDDTLNS